VPICFAIGVGLAAFAWLNHLNPPPFLTDDGLRDQLSARDCTDLGRCHLIGPPSSVAGLYHGPVWLDLLIAVRLLGGDTASQRTAVLALVAVSVATLFVVVWHWLRASIALPAAVLLVGGLSLNVDASFLISPSVSAFADILTAAGLLCYGLSGRRRFLIVSAFALGAGINVHVGSLSLVPPLVAIGALARPRPWRELLAAAGVLVATCVITSSAALRANLIGLAERGLLIPALAGGVSLVLLCALLGSRFRRLSRDARAWLLGVILLLPFVLAALWLVFWEGHHFSIFYLHPILGPAAPLAGALLSVPFELAARWHRTVRWLPTAASVAAMALVAVAVWKRAAFAAAPQPTPWSLAEAAAVADRAIRHGWRYEDLTFRVQARACRELLTGMSLAAPAPGAPLHQGRRQLQVVKVPRAAVPASAGADDVVPLGPTTVAVVRDIDSWLQPESLKACRMPPDATAAPQCAAVTPTDTAALAPERFLFVTRSNPAIQGLDLPPPYRATYEIPLSPRAGESREVALTDSAAADGGWRITRVEGVRCASQLPARRAHLYSDSGDPGLLVIERAFGTAPRAPDEADLRYPPCVFETLPGDPLQALVGAG
jgi:hypothetical protein